MAQKSEQQDIAGINEVSNQLSDTLLKKVGAKMDQFEIGDESTQDIDNGLFLVSKGVDVIVTIALTSWVAGCVGACRSPRAARKRV